MAKADSESSVSVVCPVYGCAECLSDLVDGLRGALDDVGCRWELILVDDRGPDRSWEVMKDLASVDQRVRIIRLSKNHGQHLAIWAGLEQSRGDLVVVMDCDLQDEPAVVPKLIHEIKRSSHDAVVVDRGVWRDSALRRLASMAFFKVMKWLSGMDLQNAGNFGIYTRRLVDELLRFEEQGVFLPFMISLVGFDAGRLVVPRSSRHAGKSSYSLSKLMRHAIQIVIRFSDRPLKLSVVAGLSISLLSVGFSVILVVGRLMGGFTVPGWTSVVLSIWFLAGVFLFVLGLHGYYLGRVLDEVHARPRIIVATKIGRGLESN